MMIPSRVCQQTPGTQHCLKPTCGSFQADRNGSLQYGAAAQNWQSGRVEPSAKVNAELPIPPYAGCPYPQCNPPVPPCSYSFWETGVRPALALDATGNPRIAYDADHQQGGGCGTFTDTRLTRFALFNQP